MIRVRWTAGGPVCRRPGGTALAVLLLAPPTPSVPPGFAERVIAAAVAQTTTTTRYDGSYRRIPYPGGDVPADVGVCTDVVIRAAGDLVTWMLPGNLPHIGLVSDRRSGDGQRPLIVHNIGNGPEIEDMLFAFTITGHYRYRGE